LSRRGRPALVALLALVVLAWADLHRGDETATLPDAFTPPPPRALAVVDPPGNIDELRARIAAILAKEDVPGTAIALVDRDGPVWVGGVGVRNLETRAPIDGDTVFRVGSLSKSIVALGVMRLVDQGKLDIDRPLREILPGVIDNPWEAETPVTLAHLMEHTAGLDDLRFNEVFTDDEDLTASAALALNPRSRIVRWRPGTRHAYANGGYTIAARAIEVAAGEPFDVYLRREILQPLGIRDADYRRSSSSIAYASDGAHTITVTASCGSSSFRVARSISSPPPTVATAPRASVAARFGSRRTATACRSW
jgi:CubicO group peptidase (beta-lactamase class C family)